MLCAFPLGVMAQSVDSMDVSEKLLFHAQTVFSPQALAGSALYAGFLQTDNSPREWGQGAGAYGKRFASTVATTAIHGALAFGLDSTLHQDPRYYRSADTGFWRRTGHAFRGTILTRTDRGGETLSTWRIGSAYGSEFLSNQWYPGRLNTVRLSLLEGTIRLGFDFASNLGLEFWPDVKRKLRHHIP
ncbi:MAG: hypothetical protein ABSE21_14305 [Bryobacteraceae bacterium]